MATQNYKVLLMARKLKLTLKMVTDDFEQLSLCETEEDTRNVLFLL